MEILKVKGDNQYFCDKIFDYRYLAPILHFVNWKIECNSWDDYNEFFHAIRLIEKLKKLSGIWFHSHCISNNNSIIGFLLIVGGDIQKIEKKYSIENESESILLKYFHIIPKGIGFGNTWLNSVIIPLYQDKKFKNIYVNSSHEKSFPFYQRLGSLIATYHQESDNGLYLRKGNCFLISI